MRNDKVIVTEEMLKAAKDWAEPFRNEFTIRTDDFRLIVGAIAEIDFSLRNPDAIRISSNDYCADFILRGKRVDVKCKQRTTDCKESYSVGIEPRQKDCDVDWYAFYSFNTTNNELHFLGWFSKPEFFEKAKLYKKGEVDTDNNWTAPADYYTLKISELK